MFLPESSGHFLHVDLQRQRQQRPLRMFMVSLDRGVPLKAPLRVMLLV
jgi:hypothetical protein